MTKIIGIRLLDETIQPTSGSGDNWHMTWAKNDKQYTGLCDGCGWSDMPEYTGKGYNTRMYAICGDAPDHKFEYMDHYPELESISVPGGRYYSRYYGFGILALDNSIYHFLSTPKKPFGDKGNAFIGVKLIYSTNEGLNWDNQDGTPVYWEEWHERTSDNMLFFNEPGECFSLLTVLQMGKNYEYNTDGYVYIYSPNGNIDNKMNQLVMLRVKKDKILKRSEYEYFVSTNQNNEAKWSKDINERGVVCTFPDGWVNWTIGHPYSGHPYAWQPSVVYNKALDIYMMANWGIGVGNNGDWFEKPSYLGFWISQTPWGPWTQIYEDESWKPDGNEDARCYQPQISPKWISEDGKSFWLVWTDFRLIENHRPYYAFNCQKVEIITE